MVLLPNTSMSQKLEIGQALLILLLFPPKLQVLKKMCKRPFLATQDQLCKYTDNDSKIIKMAKWLSVYM